MMSVYYEITIGSNGKKIKSSDTKYLARLMNCTEEEIVSKLRFAEDGATFQNAKGNLQVKKLFEMENFSYEKPELSWKERQAETQRIMQENKCSYDEAIKIKVMQQKQAEVDAKQAWQNEFDERVQGLNKPTVQEKTLNATEQSNSYLKQLQEEIKQLRESVAGSPKVEEKETPVLQGDDEWISNFLKEFKAEKGWD